jgi:hypothetical protein
MKVEGLGSFYGDFLRAGVKQRIRTKSHIRHLAPINMGKPILADTDFPVVGQRMQFDFLSVTWAAM